MGRSSAATAATAVGVCGGISAAAAYVVASTSTNRWFCPLHRASSIYLLAVAVGVAVSYSLFLRHSAIPLWFYCSVWCVQRLSAVYVFVSVAVFFSHYYYYYNGTMILSILFCCCWVERVARTSRAKKTYQKLQNRFNFSFSWQFESSGRSAIIGPVKKLNKTNFIVFFFFA